MRLFNFFSLLFLIQQLTFAASSTSSVSVEDSTHDETLILHDGTIDFESDYSLFLKDQAKYFANTKLVFKNVKEESTQPVKLISDVDSNLNLYRSLIIFPITGRGLGRKLTSGDLLKFANNANGNILVIDSEQGANDEIRNFLNQLGIYPSPKNYQLYDHFNYDAELGADKHDVLSLPVSKHLLDKDHIIVEETLKQDNVLFSGASAALSNNELLIPVLQAPRTAFNYNPKKVSKKNTDEDAKYVNDVNYWALGNQNYLIVAFQNLVNSRVSWIGSSKFLSDAYYKQSNYKNEKIVNDLLRWTFAQKNVLKIDYVEFYKTSNNTFNSKLLKDTFKVKDEVVYTLAISEFKDNQWVPYDDNKDLQLEFTMLDPYYRITLQKIDATSRLISLNNPELSNSSTNTTFHQQKLSNDLTHTQFYSTKFNLPDQHGMFKFLVDYKRPGFSFLHSENIITLRNLANDEYQKSWEIVNSWVYLSAIIALIAGWFVFLNLFLFSDETKKVANAKKNN